MGWGLEKLGGPPDCVPPLQMSVCVTGRDGLWLEEMGEEKGNET